MTAWKLMLMKMRFRVKIMAELYGRFSPIHTRQIASTTILTEMMTAKTSKV